MYKSGPDHVRFNCTQLTHSYKLQKYPQSQCEHCQCILTVRHILVECNHPNRTKKDIFGSRDVVESFSFHLKVVLLLLLLLLEKNLLVPRHGLFFFCSIGLP